MHDSLLISPLQVVIGTEVYLHSVARLLTSGPPTVLCALLDFPRLQELAETINNYIKIA